MIKRSLLLFTAVLLYSSLTLAQQWTYSGTIPAPPDTMNDNTGVQFVAVDPNGRIWVRTYRTTGDSLFVPDSNMYKRVYPVLVYNADGTLWKRITHVTIGGTMYPFYWSGYGIEKDHNGNMLIANYDELYRVNYQTGDGMNGPLLPFGVNNAMGAPAVDAAGNIYIVRVLPGSPLKKYDPDFNFLSNVADTILDYGRYCEVSLDGFTVYAPRYSANKVIRFRTPSEFDPYVADTILHGAAVESGTWDPVDPTKIWFSIGHTGYNPPTGIFAGRIQTYLMFDTATWAFTDSIKMVVADPANERPRGIAFSLDGTKAYLAEFGTSLPYPVQVHTNPQHVVGIIKDNNTVVENYSLGQNYPNPFNPTTSIKFTVANPGFVTLKVYDILGNEVATLVNEEMSNGSFTVNFDASNLASGTYVYRMTANGNQISKKMLLMK